MAVTAPIYDYVEAQTKKGNVGLVAWCDQLKLGDKVIAKSRDLIRKGLKNNKEVKIEGIEEIYIFKDKMNKRWQNKIDIYIGLDRNTAIN